MTLQCVMSGKGGDTVYKLVDQCLKIANDHRSTISKLNAERGSSQDEKTIHHCFSYFSFVFEYHMHFAFLNFSHILTVVNFQLFTIT